MGSRVPLREHLPDGEVHWPEPDGAPMPGPPGPQPSGAELAGPQPSGPELAGPEPAAGQARGAVPAWAGECWAIEAELTRKTVRRTAVIMSEILTRTGDYGCPAAEVTVPGRLPRHARVLYVCSPAARPTVTRARDALPGVLAGRVEIRGLPGGAALDARPPPAARPPRGSGAPA
jgi:hypothetical protein